MTATTVAPCHIIGMAIRTTNEQMHAAEDIPQLWAAFMSGNAATEIPGIQGPELYCVYTEYELDHTRPYTVVLGYKVDSLEQVPEGYKGITIGGGPYEKLTARGKLAAGIVYDAWLKVWDVGWQRTYTTDFEVYGTKAQDPDDAEVDIFIAVKA